MVRGHKSFHPEHAHSEAVFRQKLDRMHNNPVRAGYVTDPSAWVYSSAAAYLRSEESAVPIAGIEW